MTRGSEPLLVDFSPHTIRYAGGVEGLWFVSHVHGTGVMALDLDGQLRDRFPCPPVDRVVSVEGQLVGLSWEHAWGRRWGYSHLNERPHATGYDLRTGRKLWHLAGGLSGLAGARHGIGREERSAASPHLCFDLVSGKPRWSFRAREPRGGLRFGFLSHDWRFGQETDDVVAELARCLEGEPLTFEKAWVEQVDLEEGGLDAVAAFINDKLAAASARRRIFSLETDGDWHAYIVRTPREMKAMVARGFRGLLQ